MDHNTPHDESEYLSPRQSAYNRLHAHIARMDDRITLLLEGNRIDELSANQREQLAARYEGILLRLRTLIHKIETDETESDIESSREAELAEVIGPYLFRPGTLGQTSPEVIAVLHDA